MPLQTFAAGSRFRKPGWDSAPSRLVKSPNPARAHPLVQSRIAENRIWHACCIMNGMTGQAPANETTETDMNIKTTLFSAFAALMVSGLAVGSAIAPASVAIAAPVVIAQHA